MVINGSDAHPLWAYLAITFGGVADNFTKFLVNGKGLVIDRFEPE